MEQTVKTDEVPASVVAWKDDGKPIDSQEQRRHPEDKEGVFYKFEELKADTAGQLSDADLEALWRRMKPRSVWDQEARQIKSRPTRGRARSRTRERERSK